MVPVPPPTYSVYTCDCYPRVTINGECQTCGREVRSVRLVERREIRTFDVVRNGPPPVPPWAREKRRRVTRPGRR